MNIEDRVNMNRQLAEGYRDGYLQKSVHKGKKYEGWKFTEDATYMSPYYTGGKTIPFSSFIIPGLDYSTLEARAFSTKFPDWGPVDFKIWPAENGFAMRVRWEGHTKSGTKMGFYHVGLVETNDQGLITHWESHHNNEEFEPFLKVALGAVGPFPGPAEGYLELCKRAIEISGQSV